MKKVISIVVAIALALSCCVVAFASDTNCSAATLSEYLGYVDITPEDIQRVLATNGVTIDDPSANLPSETIAQLVVMFLDDGCMQPSQAEGLTNSLSADNFITMDQKNEIDGAVNQWVVDNTPADQPGEGEGGDDSGEGGGFDLGGITDTIKNIFSNLGNFDLGSFGEGAKSGLGQLIDGLSGAGLPDLSSITGLLGGLGGGGDILGTIMGLLGLGGGDDGSSTPSTPVTPSTPGTNTNTNTAVIPKTADTAPIAAVATLAVVAGVAFVLTRKKNEE
ncbi:MAG: hypothetical protein E7515_03230 [Ruminococcaceae bacterium]|jgi:hypothetical protein|nr:hypothetical protein [Oscillospiraceae bacterium]